MPDLEAEMKKKLNRPVSDLPPSGDASLQALQRGNHVSNGSNGNGNGHGRAPVMTTLSATIAHFQLDAPTCPSCGHVAVRNGACYKCLNCGESLGCS
jgi:ribonucleoside-diphosphate reductase alpha chain